VGYRKSRGGSQFEYRDLCRIEIVHRQLALGGVPFYLRTGKRMAKRVTEIAIQFCRPPFVLFRNTAVKNLDPNRLGDPDSTGRGHHLRLQREDSGPVMTTGLVKMDFDYARDFGKSYSSGMSVCYTTV